MNNINILLFLSCLIFYKYSDTKNKYIKNGVGILSIYFLYKIISNGKRIKEGLIDMLPGNGIFASPGLDTRGMDDKCIVDQIEEQNLLRGSGEAASPNPYYHIMRREGMYLRSDSKCKQIRDGHKYLENEDSCEFQCSDKDGKSRVLKRDGDSFDAQAPTRHFVKCQVNSDGQAQIMVDESVKCKAPPAQNPNQPGKAVDNPPATDKEAVGRINSQVCKNTTSGDSDLIYDSRPEKNTDIFCDPNKGSVDIKTRIKKCCIPEDDAYVSWRDGWVGGLLYGMTIFRTVIAILYLIYFVLMLALTEKFGTISLPSGALLGPARFAPGNQQIDNRIRAATGLTNQGARGLTPATDTAKEFGTKLLVATIVLVVLIGLSIGVEAIFIYALGDKKARFGLEGSNDVGGLWDQWKLFGFFRGDGPFNFGNADREKVKPNLRVKGLHKGRDSGDGYSIQEDPSS